MGAARPTVEVDSGRGRRTAHTLLGHLPELGTLTGKQIAALAGLAHAPATAARSRATARFTAVARRSAR